MRRDEKRCSKRARIAFRSSANSSGIACTASSMFETMRPVSRSSMISGTGSTREGKHRCSAGHGLDHDQSEGFGPIDRKQQSGRSTKKLRLGAFVDLANKLNFCPLQKRGNHLPEVGVHPP